MSILSKTELRTLVKAPRGSCISFYMPTHRAGPETRQDPIRLKNLIQKAEEELVAGGLRAVEARDLLQPVSQLVQDSNRDFWQYQSDGLAIFLAPDCFYYYRLPLRFEELVVVTDRFHLKPLMPLFTGNGRFYILALSQNQIRLLQATQYSVSDIALEGVVQSLSEALQYDDPEEQLQLHTQGQGRTPIYHGQGVGTTDAKDEIWRYFQIVDRDLQAVLPQQESTPLVLAGVEYLHPIYREVNSYPHLLNEGVTGNPDESTPEELHQQAWTVVQPHFQEAQQQAIHDYEQFVGTGQASAEFQDIVSAAYHGQVETLFVALERQEWGKFNPDTNKAKIDSENSPEAEDLLDFAAVHTLMQGGTVYAVALEKMPTDAVLAAVFRYPLPQGQPN